jgi:hypothetical protein
VICESWILETAVRRPDHCKTCVLIIQRYQFLIKNQALAAYSCTMVIAVMSMQTIYWLCFMCNCSVREQVGCTCGFGSMGKLPVDLS